jgi:hypothetical protein
MFTHADFNRRGRTIVYAFISQTGVGGISFARLFRFASGDVAWWARGQFIAWPRKVHIHNRIGRGIYVPAYLREYASPLPGAL